MPYVWRVQYFDKDDGCCYEWAEKRWKAEVIKKRLMIDADIERITHKTAGAHTCAYDIRVEA